jgi:hypothetical protein
MNWMQKSAEGLFGNVEEWKDGDLGILSIFAWKDIAVFQTVDWDDVAHSSDKYELVDLNTIKGESITWKRGEVVPCKILKTYGTVYASHYTPGEIRMVGAQNIYHTFIDLVKKQSRTTYPDLILGIMSSNTISQLSKDFPQLLGAERLSDLVSYEQYQSDHGYMIQIFTDPTAYQGYGRTKPEFPYYWYLPSLKVRSLDFNAVRHNPESKELIKLIWSEGGSFRYRTIEDALAAVDKYLDYMFPESPEEKDE